MVLSTSLLCLLALAVQSLSTRPIEPLSQVCDSRRASPRDVWESLQAAAADCQCGGNCCCDVQAAVAAYDMAGRPYGGRIDDVCDCLLSSSEDVSGRGSADWGGVAGGTFGADLTDCDVAACIEEELQGLVDRVDVADDDDDGYVELAIVTRTPTAAPTPAQPTRSPTPAPTLTPTSSPTAYPTFSPSPSPTTSPTLTPTYVPTASPTVKPTGKVILHYARAPQSNAGHFQELLATNERKRAILLNNKWPY
eukprot:CAMPEP_0170738262 /NCGR_PEP_ID=MMETSP0437-20130122/4556_1 /TAXON_ID=0 /ORGANISM="Sexangularia sp." /LENGTH=250 /DNA_ID=CAMNT_0011076683 /DNA_START=29 /DNA_END=779 /DNA_ORIENTATION=+